MTHTPPLRRDCTPAEAIAHALDDHWLTTPPDQPIYHSQAAETVLDYLQGHGYTIQPAAPATAPQPAGRAITALDLVLALACVGAAINCLTNGLWIWAIAGAVGAALFAREAHQGLTARRGRRPSQPQDLTP